ncbi:hypothetical protein GCM10023069_02930 [Shinella granuli]
MPDGKATQCSFGGIKALPAFEHVIDRLGDRKLRESFARSARSQVQSAQRTCNIAQMTYF